MPPISVACSVKLNQPSIPNEGPILSLSIHLRLWVCRILPQSSPNLIYRAYQVGYAKYGLQSSYRSNIYLPQDHMIRRKRERALIEDVSSVPKRVTRAMGFNRLLY